MTENQNVIFELGEVTSLTIDRPSQLNALNSEVLSEISTSCEVISQTSSVKVVVLKGSGSKAFVAGADIRAMNDLSDSEIREYIELGGETMSALEKLNVPVVAAVNGFALGGGLELALAADIILCTEEARFGFPEVTLGLIPGFGGTQRAQQRIGLGATKRLAFTGEMIGAKEALRMGLVDKVFPSADFSDGVEQFIAKICANGPVALRALKDLFRNEHPKEGLQQEREAFLAVFKSADRKEGISAFLEKKKASFKAK